MANVPSFAAIGLNDPIGNVLKSDFKLDLTVINFARFKTFFFINKRQKPLRMHT